MPAANLKPITHRSYRCFSMITLWYDGSFAGLLTCIFEVYERRLKDVSIFQKQKETNALFGDTLDVITNITKANRVWNGLQKRLSRQGCKNVVWNYLSELEGFENALLAFSRYVFDTTENVETNFGNPAVLQVAQTAKKVGREKHRMEAFVRFQQLKDGLYYAAIRPDYNVLPLILPHFKSRYADQHWLIYDLQRGYGIKYDAGKETVEEVNISVSTDDELIPNTAILAEGELYYQDMWKDYFHKTGIPERRNMKLHLQHVPRRYWKYLTEKL